MGAVCDCRSGRHAARNCAERQQSTRSIEFEFVGDRTRPPPNRFHGELRGGLKYFFTDRFALMFDVRDQIGHYKATLSNIAGVPGGIVTGSKTLNDFQITGGIFSIWQQRLKTSASALVRDF